VRIPARIIPYPTGRLFGLALFQALRAWLRSHRPSGTLLFAEGFQARSAWPACPPGQKPLAHRRASERSALDELRLEFEDIRLRLRRTPEQFIVLSDLAVRSWRDPVVAKIFRKLDDGWHAHLVALLERGIQQGIFRNKLNVSLCARAMMVALRGIGYQSRLPPRKIDELLSELAAQTERWIMAEDAPQ
jgi:hypothetical protein